MKAALQRILVYARRQGLLGLLKKLPQFPRLSKIFLQELQYQRSLRTEFVQLPQLLHYQAQRAQSFTRKPLISVILPTYKPHLPWLKQAVDSVLTQSYSSFELCIADDASQNEELTRYLQDLTSQDFRVKLIQRTQNGHICANTNSALSLATGDYVAFLDHDDKLDPQALFKVAEILQTQPDLEFIYTDEDKISAEDLRSEPTRKTEFDKERLYRTMFTGHLAVFKHSLVKELEGLCLGTEGAQDWDLLLRALEFAESQGRDLKVGHVPSILYHWRKHQGSTASNPSSKPYAHQASFKVLTQHFERTNQKRSLHSSPAPGFYEWR